MVRPPRFEVIPLPGIEEAILEHLPAQATVTVTASARQGLAATLELATALAVRGIEAVPHLAARHIRDTTELQAILQDLEAAGIGEVFVIGGDRKEPAGQFFSALELLEAMQTIGHTFTVGVAAYPETHPLIADEDTVQAVQDKQAHASYLVSQMSFDAQGLLQWVGQLRRRGIDLPLIIGVAGPVSTARLLRIGAKVGVGDSLRMLRKHRGAARHLPGAWAPEHLLEPLGPAFTESDWGLAGVHIYTFNALAETARWWHQATSHQPSWAADSGSVDHTSGS